MKNTIIKSKCRDNQKYLSDLSILTAIICTLKISRRTTKTKTPKLQFRLFLRSGGNDGTACGEDGPQQQGSLEMSSHVPDAF